MAHFRLGLDPVNGPIINAVIAVSEARAVALQAAGQDIPQPKAVRALVDTGASGTCVDPWVLSALGLSPTGSILVHTPSSGEKGEYLDQYDVGLAIFGAGSHHPPLVKRTVAAIASDLKKAQGIDALLGRDVLGDCVLIYNGTTGDFTLAF